MNASTSQAYTIEDTDSMLAPLAKPLSLAPVEEKVLAPASE